MEEHDFHYSEILIKLFLRGLLPVVLLVSGVVLLVLEIPGWSIIFGFPMIIIGVVFLIYTYDYVIRRRVLPVPTKLPRCKKCGRLIPPTQEVDPKNPICYSCKKDRAPKQ